MNQMPDESTDKDPWRQLHQALPLDIYDRLIVQLGRLGLANGIAPSAFLEDDKTRKVVGPRVGVWELLVILMENTESRNLRND